MAAFEYVALDAGGRRRKGVIEADSPRQVRARLREQALAPLEVAPTRGRGETTRAPLAWRRGLSSAERALVTRQLATLVQAALPVEEALHAAAAQAGSNRIKSMLLTVRARVLEGHGLAASLRGFPAAFPELYRATVAAGEHSGHLGLVLEQLAEYTEQQQQAWQRIQLALLYPLILVVVAVAIVGFLLGYVVPDVVEVFVNTGQPLPWLTRALIATSGLAHDWGAVALVVALAGGLALRHRRRDPRARRRWHRGLLRVPGLSRLLRAAELARFASTLAILVRSSVPLVDALGIASQVVGNLVLRDRLEAAARGVREGGSLSRALERSGECPPMMLHMVASGEKSGELGPMLARTARNQENDLAARIALLVGMFEPFMLVCMGGVVLVIVLAILLPIMSLNQLVG